MLWQFTKMFTVLQCEIFEANFRSARAVKLSNLSYSKFVLFEKLWQLLRNNPQDRQCIRGAAFCLVTPADAGVAQTAGLTGSL